MARLTWQNVSSPNFAGVTDAYRLAGQLMNNGFNSLDGAIGDFQKEKQQRADQALMADVLKYNDAGSLDSAVKQGLLDGRGSVSAEALKFAGNRSGDLLTNQAKAEANSQTQWINDRNQGFEAARPEAVAKLTEIRQLYQQGTPEAKAQADQLVANSTGTFAAAGWTPDHIASFMQGNDAAINTGIQQKDAFNQAADSAEARTWDKAGEKLAKEVYANSGDANVALRNLQSRADVDPRVLAKAQEYLAQFGQADGPAPTATDLAVQAQTSNRGSALQGLVDRNEGGGRYDTLYGHVQAQKDSPFAGVDVSKATLGELKQFASSNGNYGRYQTAKLGKLATPMGRYQIVGQTLRNAAKEMGLPDSTVFTPQVQDAIFNHLVDGRLSKAGNMAEAIKGLRQEWEGFKNVPDAQLAQAITAYQNGDKNAIVGPGGAADYGNSASGKSGINPASQLIADLTKKNGKVAQAEDPNAGPINIQEVTGVQNTATDIITRSQQLQNTITLDTAFDQTAPIMQALTDTSGRTLKNSDVSKNLVDKIGDQDGVNRPEIDYFINWARNKYGVSADIAGAMIEQSIGKTNWGARWIWGDRSANKDTLDTIYKNVFGGGNFNDAKGTNALARMQKNQITKAALAQADSSTAALQPAQAEYYRAVKKFGTNSPQAKTAKLRFEALKGVAEKQLSLAEKNPLLTSNINSRTGR